MLLFFLRALVEFTKEQARVSSVALLVLVSRGGICMIVISRQQKMQIPHPRLPLTVAGLGVAGGCVFVQSRRESSEGVSGS